jgi:hypothetical protein
MSINYAMILIPQTVITLLTADSLIAYSILVQQKYQ